MIWQTTRHAIDLSVPRVMGIVNVTPDSFADGDPARDARAAIALCERLVGEGADILDIGGASTRPGAAPVPIDVEIARVEPVLAAAVALGVPVSIDTRRAAALGVAGQFDWQRTVAPVAAVFTRWLEESR